VNKKDLGLGIAFWAIAFISTAILTLVDLALPFMCYVSLLLLASVLGGSYFIRKGMYGTGEY